MCLRLATLSIFILIPVASAQNGELERYAYSWPLTLNGDSAAWQVELPLEAYQSVTDPLLRDLVVVGERQTLAGEAALQAPTPASKHD